MPLLDDALIHQNYGMLDNVVDKDPRFFDRFYFNGSSGLSVGKT